MTTIVAELTPPGRGAVATLVVQGPAAWASVAQWFRPARARRGEPAPLQAILFGSWQAPGVSAGEELVVCRTAEDAVEVHCHGGLAAVNAIVGSLEQSGCQRIAWSQWLTRAEPDRIRAGALLALSKASTERAAALLLDQYRGALRAELLQIVALLEDQQTTAAQQRLQALLRVAPFGLSAQRPFRVLLTGAPNVGKSSLINRLLGFERSIVYDAPGTTRDVVTAHTALAGWPVELRDLAGLRTARDEIEAAGVTKALEEFYDADLLLWVRDPLQAEDLTGPLGKLRDLHGSLGEQQSLLVVWNKSDLLSRQEPEAITLSALTGAGIADLHAAIVQRLFRHAPTPGAAAPFLQAQVAALRQARAALDQAHPDAARQFLLTLL